MIEKIYVWRSKYSGMWRVDVFGKGYMQFNTFEEARSYLNGDKEGSELQRMQLRNNWTWVRSDPASKGLFRDQIVGPGRLT